MKDTAAGVHRVDNSQKFEFIGTRRTGHKHTGMHSPSAQLLLLLSSLRTIWNMRLASGEQSIDDDNLQWNV